jgi:hypothetical protein
MNASPETATGQQKKGQRLFMTGMGLVMFGCIFGGGLAIVFYFLGLRPAAIVAGLIAAAAIIVGVWLQVSGAKLLKARST